MVRLFILGFAALLLVFRKRFKALTTTDLVDFDLINYFSSSEFDSPDAPDSGLNMKKVFVEKLDSLRHHYGRPLKINSGYRTLDHNARVGGSFDSAHLTGWAADIHCSDTLELKTLYALAKDLGFKRVGQYRTKKGNYFLHVDLHPLKSYQGSWYSVNGSLVDNPIV